jgi:hypothetical protein
MGKSIVQAMTVSHILPYHQSKPAMTDKTQKQGQDRRMNPSQFVAILGTGPETWPALAGRDDRSPQRKHRKNGRIWLWKLLLLRKSPNIEGKGGCDKTILPGTGSDFGSGGCRTGHPQVEKGALQIK